MKSEMEDINPTIKITINVNILNIQLYDKSFQSGVKKKKKKSKSKTKKKTSQRTKELPIILSPAKKISSKTAQHQKLNKNKITQKTSNLIKNWAEDLKRQVSK